MEEENKEVILEENTEKAIEEKATKEIQKTVSFKITSIQELLSIGYLVLLFFGLIRETILYGFLGVNIITYSNVLDILLSPVAILTGNVYLMIAIVFSVFFFYWGTTFFIKFHESNRDKRWYQKLFDVPKLEKNYFNGDFSIISFVGFMGLSMLLGVFLGGGIIDGYKLKNKILKGEHEVTHRLTFNDKEIIPVKVIGQNSQYVFYVLEDSTEIAVSPIQGNIKRIEKLKKKTED